MGAEEICGMVRRAVMRLTLPVPGTPRHVVDSVLPTSLQSLGWHAPIFSRPILNLHSCQKQLILLSGISAIVPGACFSAEMQCLADLYAFRVPARPDFP